MSEKTAVVTTRIPAGLKERAVAACEHHGVTMTEVIRLALEQWAAQAGPDGPPKEEST